MNSRELENLARIGSIKPQPASQAEIVGLVRLCKARLQDARNSTISIESRFDLAYNAAHALCLAALRRCGYRSTNRFIVFQCLPHTLGLSAPLWRVLAKCHERRNLAEYEGHMEVDEQLLMDVLNCVDAVFATLTGENSPA